MLRRAFAFFLLLMLAAAAPALADEPFRIGVLNDQSGPYADLSGPGGAESARMAIEDAGGTFGGQHLGGLVGPVEREPERAQHPDQHLPVDPVHATVGPSVGGQHPGQLGQLGQSIEIGRRLGEAGHGAAASMSRMPRAGTSTQSGRLLAS